MPGEGERGGEGRENSEEDPFESFAEELERKQRESKGGDEPDKDMSDSTITTTWEPAEPPKGEGDTEIDEFEAFAKELQEKYGDNNGAIDPIRAGQSDSDADKTGALQEGQASAGSNEKAIDEQKAHLNPFGIPQDVIGAGQSSDSVSNEVEPDRSPNERLPEDGGLKDSNQGRQIEDGERPDELLALPKQTSSDEISGGTKEPTLDIKEGDGIGTEGPSPRKDLGPYEGNRGIPANVAGTETPQRREGIGSAEHHLDEQKSKDPEPMHITGIDIRTIDPPGITKSRDAKSRRWPTEAQDNPDVTRQQANPSSHDGTLSRQGRNEQAQGFTVPPTSGFTAPGGQSETRQIESPSTELKDYIANVPVRAVRNGEGAQYFPIFNIPKSSIEEQAGINLKSGGFYHLVGSVEGAFDFDIHRVAKNYVRIMTPLEHRDKVEFGKVYNINLKAIEEVQLNEKQREIVANSVGLQYRPLMYRLQHANESGTKSELRILQPEKVTNPRKDDGNAVAERLENIGAIFILRAHLHDRRGDRRYFTLPNAQFEQKTSLKIEEMRDYAIKGEIQGVGEFRKVLWRCAARQDVPIYVSSQLSKSIEIGKEYVIKIDSIEKLVRPKPWEGIRLDELKPWSWKEVASWVDTEGAVCCPTERGGTYQIQISQKEKKVLAEIAYFLDEQGLRSSLKLSKATGVYNLHITGVETMARVIKEVEPFIRTENKIIQISEFKKSICKPRRTLWSSIRNAREILGLTDRYLLS
ncbi:MAG TPA: hypothetical protein VGR56_00110 [Nitrososphaerales archaeon]|nr:hypothetical protein [Nitrososphaerales archaeon]